MPPGCYREGRFTRPSRDGGQVRMRTPSFDAQAASDWTVKPTAVSNADGGTGSTDRRTFALIALPWIAMPAVGLELIPTRQKSFGAVAPPASVTVWACHPAGFWWLLAGFLLMVAALAITLAIEVPIDRQIQTWTAATLPADWRSIQARWERWHTLRTFASIAALVAATLSATIAAPAPRRRATRPTPQPEPSPRADRHDHTKG